MSGMIWKYKLPVQGDGSFNLDLPLGSQLLKVAMQGDEPCMWVMFKKPDEGPVQTISRKFRWIGTGNEFDPGAGWNSLIHIDTVQLAGGAFVLHLFEA